MFVGGKLAGDYTVVSVLTIPVWKPSEALLLADKMRQLSMSVYQRRNTVRLTALLLSQH